MTTSTIAEVFSYKRLGEHFHVLTIVAPEISAEAKPGQFVSIRLPSDESLLLRRPFSIHRVDRKPGWAGAIEVVFDIRGRGTQALAECRPHSLIDLIGPLGRPFRIPTAPTSCLLVGGGIGTAPLLFLAEELHDAGHDVTFLIGGRTHEHLLRPIDAKRVASNVHLTTDDGSQGTQGLVTDVMDDLIDQVKPTVIYTCGPTEMLKAVAGISRKRRVSCQVAWEEVMACGFGACLVCAVPVWLNRSDRTWAWARCCVEGPVFSANRICWEMTTAMTVEPAELPT